MSYHNKSRGYSLERRVKLAFEEAGYGAKRNEFSATPDVLVFKGNTLILGLECKNRTQKDNKPIYIPKRQVDILSSFCSKFEIMPYIVFSFYRETPKVIAPGLLKRTRSGQLVIDKDVYRNDSVVELKEFIANLAEYTDFYTTPS